MTYDDPEPTTMIWGTAAIVWLAINTFAYFWTL
jgi:hypothetical protein